MKDASKRPIEAILDSLVFEVSAVQDLLISFERVSEVSSATKDAQVDYQKFDLALQLLKDLEMVLSMLKRGLPLDQSAIGDLPFEDLLLERTRHRFLVSAGRHEIGSQSSPEKHIELF